MRTDAVKKPGGDVIQIKKYIEWGFKKNLFHGELICNLDADLSSYDFIHLTNIDRPVEAISFYRKAKKHNKKFCISTIHHSYDEIEKFEKLGRKGFASIISSRLNFSNLETLRSLHRSLKFPKLAVPTLTLAFLGMKKFQRLIIKEAEAVFALSKKEIDDICKDFEVLPNDANFIIARNGVDISKTDYEAVVRDIDICVVGRIEARKNQLQILRAANKLNVKAVFVGACNVNHKEYVKKFFSELEYGKSEYLPPVPAEDVHALLRRSKVHVSASWFEVASLVDIEAALSGCKVVSSICGSTNEVLGSSAYYVDPASQDSILHGISSALNYHPLEYNPEINETSIASWLDSSVTLADCYMKFT